MVRYFGMEAQSMILMDRKTENISTLIEKHSLERTISAALSFQPRNRLARARAVSAGGAIDYRPIYASCEMCCQMAYRTQSMVVWRHEQPLDNDISCHPPSRESLYLKPFPPSSKTNLPTAIPAKSTWIALE